MSSGNNYNVNAGTQGANIVNSRVDNLNVTLYNTGQPGHQIDIFETFSKYKQWACKEKAHSIVRKKLKQLVIDGKHCKIERKLKGDEGKFTEDQKSPKIIGIQAAQTLLNFVRRTKVSNIWEA